MRLTINLTDEQNAALDRLSDHMGITKNGLICLAVHEWLDRSDPERQHRDTRRV